MNTEEMNSNVDDGNSGDPEASKHYNEARTYVTPSIDDPWIFTPSSEVTFTSKQGVQSIYVMAKGSDFTFCDELIPIGSKKDQLLFKELVHSSVGEHGKKLTVIIDQGNEDKLRRFQFVQLNFEMVAEAKDADGKTIKVRSQDPSIIIPEPEPPKHTP
ncbi:hypothetical protein KIH87_05975 [Paraneptunicella aestuarii]|uniref:hypothetical protein n=1 Tax=Paraneptunicella aestuarii TaxID=2831148 RepID=UPI001E58C4B6|nr:hypothetical protein [Paraneptunicella aestuarii]UAA39899.1 hypothetical protein KIH87_05975 [Paraneptunicella aestuarii]